MRGLVAPVLMLSATFGGFAHAANMIAVSVVDERNTGVQSRILLSQQGSPLGDTDATGHFQKAYKCQNGDYIKARPADIGSYFESAEAACAPTLTLRVVSKQTPEGAASSVRLEQINLPNGLLGFVILKGRVDTDLEGIRSGGCDAEVTAGVYAQAYIVDGDKWVLAGSKDATLAQALTEPTHDQATASLDTCEINDPKLMALRTNLEDYLADALKYSEVNPLFTSNLIQNSPQ